MLTVFTCVLTMPRTFHVTVDNDPKIWYFIHDLQRLPLRVVTLIAGFGSKADDLTLV